LALAGIANAAIDVSDGLLQDLGHICTAANLAATVHASLIPFSTAAAPYAAAALETMLTEGDDYELLLAVPPDRTKELFRACGDLRITKIGSFSAGDPTVTVLDANGKTLNFAKSGWRHFS
jgi:thiamine-monophosphate kinase